MSRIRLMSCSLELDGRSLLAARPKASVHVTQARVLVPIGFVASAVRTQLPGFSLAIPDDARKPTVAFAGEFEADDVLPEWARRLIPEKWQGKFSVEGLLELRVTPSGRIQVVVLDAEIAGLHVPKALNIQRFVLERVRRHIASSPLLRKGTGDALFEIDLPALAKRAGVTLDLPVKSAVSLEGDDVVISFGAVASSAKTSPPLKNRAAAKASASRTSASRTSASRTSASRTSRAASASPSGRAAKRKAVTKRPAAKRKAVAKRPAAKPISRKAR